MNKKENNPATQPGGYHSHGKPGEEADARKSMRVLKILDTQETINRSYPVKGGGSAQDTADGRLEQAAEGATIPSTGERALYVLTRKDSERVDTPVLRAGENGEQEGIPVFTSRENAWRYLQMVHWENDHEPGKISPTDLSNWLDEAQRDGINLVIVDPDPLEQQQGTPQPVLFLKEMTDFSGEVLYREINDMARGPRS